MHAGGPHQVAWSSEFRHRGTLLSAPPGHQGRPPVAKVCGDTESRATERAGASWEGDEALSQETIVSEFAAAGLCNVMKFKLNVILNHSNIQLSCIFLYSLIKRLGIPNAFQLTVKVSCTFSIDYYHNICVFSVPLVLELCIMRSRSNIRYSDTRIASETSTESCGNYGWTWCIQPYVW